MRDHFLPFKLARSTRPSHRGMMARTARGMMLVDILVAVIMLGTSLAILIGMTARALRAQRTGETLANVAMLLDEQLNLILARGPDEYSSRFPLEGPCDPPFEGFRYRISFNASDPAIAAAGGGGGASSSSSTSTGGTYAVSVTISWNDGGFIRTESVQTRIAPRLGDEPDPDRRPPETVDRME